MHSFNSINAETCGWTIRLHTLWERLIFWSSRSERTRSFLFLIVYSSLWTASNENDCDKFLLLFQFQFQQRSKLFPIEGMLEHSFRDRSWWIVLLLGFQIAAVIISIIMNISSEPGIFVIAFGWPLVIQCIRLSTYRYRFIKSKDNMQDHEKR